MIILPYLIQSAVQLKLDLSSPGVPVSPMLYGQMTEEINYSYDGGLYGELVRNRAFLDDARRPVHWSAAGSNSVIALERGGPSASRPMALRVSGGVSNDGYWGIPVRPATSYSLNVWAKSDSPGALTASMESADGSTVYAKTDIKNLSGQWQKLNATLRTAPGIPINKDARLVLRTEPSKTAWLEQVSLFAPNYKGQPNGFRPDLMKMLVEMKPKFLRFPGGNYVEGGNPAERYAWKNTVGQSEDRPGHRSPWGYRSTDGMGLLEFLTWCEDMRARPVLAVYAGYTLDGQHVKAGQDLQPFVEEALDEIEYVTGGPDTKWGAARVKDGHPKAFPLDYVEIGNEDGFDKSGSYESRFIQFYDAIKAKYPKIKIISTTGGKDWLGQKFPITQRRPDLWDEHYYSEAWDMMGMATKYDSYDRSGPKIFVGEWAAHDRVAPWVAGAKAGPTPNMRCALGDAAFLTGLERNSDVVEMACYAPLLVNVNPGARQWSLNLIGYDNLEAFGSPSYYAQKMFAENLGDHTIPIETSGVPTQEDAGKTLPGLFVSATRSSKDGYVYIKLVNPLSTKQEVTINLNGAKIAANGTETILSGDLKAMNSIAEPLKIAPRVIPLRGLGSTFSQSLEADSVTVLKLRVSK